MLFVVKLVEQTGLPSTYLIELFALSELLPLLQEAVSPLPQILSFPLPL